MRAAKNSELSGSNRRTQLQTGAKQENGDGWRERKLPRGRRREGRMKMIMKVILSQVRCHFFWRRTGTVLHAVVMSLVGYVR